MATKNAGRHTTAGLRWLRLQLESLALLSAVRDRLCFAAVVVASSGATCLFRVWALERHESFQSNAYDLGFFDQIIWNTSQGRLFETSFVKYNFLGQHFDPVLLFFAGLYRLGGGVSMLLTVQAGVAAFAAVPLYLAAARFSRNNPAGLFCSLAFLLSPALHTALNFDFHPEMAAFVFVFLGAYFLAHEKPAPACVSLGPVLLLKEDMALVVLPFAGLLWLSGYRRQAKLLGASVLGWTIITVFVAMPLLRGGGGDLTRRYAYLVNDTTALSLVPLSVWRAMTNLSTYTLPAAGRLLLSTGFLPLLSPLSILAALPAMLVNGLSDHPEQAGLDLHYSAPALALLWLSVLVTLERAAIWRNGRTPGLAQISTPVLAGVLLAASLASFLQSSPYAPNATHHGIEKTHREALYQSMALIPRKASVNAQSAILPHLSSRREVFEFPDKRIADYVIVDSGLAVSQESLERGYTAKREDLPKRGYALISDIEGVQVWRLD